MSRNILKVYDGPPPATKLTIKRLGGRWYVTAHYGVHSLSGTAEGSLELAWFDLLLKVREMADNGAMEV